MTLDVTKPLDINKIVGQTNLTELLDDDDIIAIGNQVVDGYEADLDSRSDWEKDLTNWTDLALQVSKARTYPWTNAANVKFPLLATAAMQFAARAYPTLVPSDGKVVKCKVVGRDEDGQKSARAFRVSTHMSYQVMYEMEEWEEDMDKLLLTLPIAGTCFKKTYFDSVKQRNVSRLILPKYLVVNYFAKSLEEAERVTEVIYLTERQIKERQLKKIYREVELTGPGDLPEESKDSTMDDDSTLPYTILEQHCFLDLDGDGYSEPYIATVDKNSRELYRLVPRFNENTVIMDEKQNIVSIDPLYFYTKYSFIPNPDGGFYDIGFGRLLGPINQSADTLINQLIDAGSLSNLQAGFIGKGLRIKMGETRFQPGEWKAVNAVGDDLKKQIFPLPVREPSEVLFKLLDLLLKSGKELASVAEIFVGKMPGQNTPATTTMATIEQGMKVFTAVYKRVYRSLAKEFKKLYKLNQQYLDPNEYIQVIDEQVQENDYAGSEDDIIPGADPTAVSSQEKQARAQAVMQVLQLGTVNPMWATQLYMDAHEIPGWQQGVMQPQPKQDPKMEAIKAKAQVDQQKAQTDMMMAQQKMQLESASKEQEMQIKQRMAEMDLQMKQMQAVLDSHKAQADLAAGQAQHQQQMQQQAASHQQNLIMQHQNNQMQAAHQEQLNKATLQRGKVKNDKSK